MGIQHEEQVPASFSDAFDENYLGNPDNVSRIVSEFLERAEATALDYMNGQMDKDSFDPAIKNLIRHYADIFSGKHDPEYKIVKGYNDFTLQHKLVADLGEFWQKRRGRWNDDAVCVLFEWLTMHLIEQLKLADGDDTLLGVMIKPSVQYTVKVLLGIEERTMP